MNFPPEELCQRLRQNAAFRLTRPKLGIVLFSTWGKNDVKTCISKMISVLHVKTCCFGANMYGNKRLKATVVTVPKSVFRGIILPKNSYVQRPRHHRKQNSAVEMYPADLRPVYRLESTIISWKTSKLSLKWKNNIKRTNRLTYVPSVLMSTFFVIPKPPIHVDQVVVRESQFSCRGALCKFEFTSESVWMCVLLAMASIKANALEANLQKKKVLLHRCVVAMQR